MSDSLIAASGYGADLGVTAAPAFDLLPEVLRYGTSAVRPLRSEEKLPKADLFRKLRPQNRLQVAPVSLSTPACATSARDSAQDLPNAEVLPSTEGKIPLVGLSRCSLEELGRIE